MSDNTESETFKQTLQRITKNSREFATGKFITKLQAEMRDRARNGFSCYTTNVPIEDNISRDQLKRWANGEKFFLCLNCDGSLTINW